MYIVEGDVRLSKNFSLSEFACRDSSGRVMFDMELVEKLQNLRNSFKRPVIVLSGYRTKDYNNSVGGAQNSQHLYGKAADIKVVGVDTDAVAAMAVKLGFRGIGIYKGFVHLDVRDKLVNTQKRSYDIWRG